MVVPGSVSRVAAATPGAVITKQTRVYTSSLKALAAITVNNVITAGALAVLVIALAAAYNRMHGLTSVVPAIAVWTLVAPWLIVGRWRRLG